MTVNAKVFVIKSGDESKSVNETVRSCNRPKVAFITTHSSAPSMNTILNLKLWEMSNLEAPVIINVSIVCSNNESYLGEELCLIGSLFLFFEWQNTYHEPQQPWVFCWTCKHVSNVK